MNHGSRYMILLTGGIGNQLFQYAYAKYINSIESKQSYVQWHIYEDPFKRENIIRDIDPHIFSPDNLINRLATRMLYDPRKRWTKIIRKFANILGLRFIIKQQPQSDYYKYIKGLNDSGITILNGYWQSAEMVNAVKDELVNKFVKAKIQLKEYVEIAKVISQHKNSVAVHIRDLEVDVDIMNSALKGKKMTMEDTVRQLISKKYYQNAVSKISCINKDAFFFVFASSNEKAAHWAPDIFPQDNYLIVPNYSQASKDYEALMLMSYCKHFIISNSTFAWWAAWIGWATQQTKPEDAIYCMPNQWDKSDKEGEISRSFKFSPQCILMND